MPIILINDGGPRETTRRISTLGCSRYNVSKKLCLETTCHDIAILHRIVERASPKYQEEQTMHRFQIVQLIPEWQYAKKFMYHIQGSVWRG